MPELTTPQIISIVIFIVVFAFIISEKIHRTTAALAGCRCAYFDWHCHVRRWHGAHRLRHTRCFGRYDDLCGGR